MFSRASTFRSARAVGGSLFGAIGFVLVAASTAWACTAMAAAYLFVVPPGGTDYLVTKGQIMAVDPLPNAPVGPVDLDTENYSGQAGMPIAVVGFCGGGAQACGGYLAPLGNVGDTTPEDNTDRTPVAIGGLYMAPHVSAPLYYLGGVDTGVPIRDPADAQGNKWEASDITSEQTDCGRNAASTRIGQVIYNYTPADVPVVVDGKSPITVVAGEGQIPNIRDDQDPVPDGQTISVSSPPRTPLATGKYVICADPLPAHIWNFFTVIL